MFFRNEYAFLSNFYASPIPLVFHTKTFVMPTVENAFQAAKLLCSPLRDDTQAANRWLSGMRFETPSGAKQQGRELVLDLDRWQVVAPTYMHRALRQKFLPGTDLAAQLLATGGQEIAEDNTHGDRLWGRVNGEGENRLGQLLMLVRAELTLASEVNPV